MNYQKLTIMVFNVAMKYDSPNKLAAIFLNRYKAQYDTDSFNFKRQTKLPNIISISEKSYRGGISEMLDSLNVPLAPVDQVNNLPNQYSLST